MVIHPQSVVHSLVEFRDGAVIAQLGPPDMKLPIQYALELSGAVGRVLRRSWTFARAFSLDFFPPDLDAFPGFGPGARGRPAGRHGRRGAERGQRIGGRRPFCRAESVSRTSCPLAEPFSTYTITNPSPTLQQLLGLDAWARKEMTKWIGA